MTKQWKAGIYARLSRDDVNYYSESASITNQKAYMIEYLNEQSDIYLVDEYVDDGYTGTNFDRPGFSDMMFDINIGRINCVIVKDLSRLGRNTTRVGELKDEIFPSKGVRFIAINDNVDTKGGIDDNDVADFKLLFNEYYVKDISKKIRSSLKASAKQGLFVGSYAPYGYSKSPLDKHKLIVDKEAAEVVKHIFIEFSKGKSGREIAENLNKNNILSPMTYRCQKLGKEYKGSAWTSHSIYEILKNEVYFGNMVQHKRENVSYKLKQRRFVDKKEQIVVYGTHEAIIDENLRIATEQALISDQHRNRKRKSGERLPILFSGLLVCNDCGGKLAATIKHNKRCYRCAKYNNSGSSTCSSHFIREDQLLELINEDIAEIVRDYYKNKNLFFKNIMQNILRNNLRESNSAKNKMIKYKSRVKMIEKTMDDLYNEKINTVITKQMSSIMSEKYDKELDELLQMIDSCDKIIKKTSISESYVRSWINTLIEIRNCKSPTASDFASIIDKVYVKETGAAERISIRYKVGFIKNYAEANELKVA